MRYDFNTLRGDFFGGITSAIVALPVALAFGVASGLGAEAGLYSAIAVGFFASVFGGTRSQISGPTAPMTVAMAVVVTTHSSTFAEAMTVVILAGLFQIGMGLLKIGRYVAYTPAVVISGFMSGIGIIIMMIQSLPFLGLPTAPGGPMGALRALPDALASANPGAVVISVLTLAAGIFWPKRFAKLIPSPLVALAVGTTLGVVWMTDIPVIGEIPTGLPTFFEFTFPSAGFLVGAVQPALILAILGSVDSLLTSLVADSITGTRHDADRELVGQGIGNIASGLIGGLPGAGATMGTVVNIRAGGSTQISGALRALLVLGLLLGLGQYVEPIPHAVLAAILIKVGWDIIDWRILTRVGHLRKEHLIVMLVTLGLTVLVDLMTGVAIGLIVAGMAQAQQLERLELESVVSVPLLDRMFFAEHEDQSVMDWYSAQVGLVALKGSFTVASAHKLMAVIGGDLKEHKVTIFDFTNVTFLDDSAAMLIGRLLDAGSRESTEVIMMGLTGSPRETLSTLGILGRLPRGRMAGSLREARGIAAGILEKRGGGRR